jgi:hypothetical protein
MDRPHRPNQTQEKACPKEAFPLSVAGVQSTPEPTQPVRPRPAKTAAVLLIVFGVLGFLLALLLMSIVSDSHGQSVPAVLYVLVIAQMALSAAQAVSGVAVWEGLSWGRGLAIAVCSVNLVGAAVSLFTGAVLPAISGAAVNIALLRLLNNYEVDVWCSK